MKNAFYFMLNGLYVLKTLNVLSWLFGHIRKRLDKKAEVNFKFYDVIDWQQINTMHISSNISTSKGLQAMKFGQWDKVRNISFQKFYRKWGRETSFRPLIKLLKTFT